MKVARLYRFTATHHVPGLPAPWCEPHQHHYTVEVVAEKDTEGIVVDTDHLDAAWDLMAPEAFSDLNEHFPSTTVEALSARWLGHFREAFPEVSQVTVWEDDSRWGQASA